MKAGVGPGFGGDFGGAPGGGARFSSSTFTNADAFNIFDDFLRNMGGGMGGMGGMHGSGRGPAMFGSSFGRGGPSSFNMFGGGPDMMGSDSMYDSYESAEPQKAADAVIDLNLTLEELATGLTKKLRVNRTITDSRGRTTQDKRTLEVPIKAGYKEGTKIRFADAGDQTATTTQDVVFVIKQKPHDKYTREGDHLIYTTDLNLDQALFGTKVLIPAFANRQPITFELKSPISSTYTHLLRGSGMPNSKTGAKGDLKVKFNILMPKSLSHSQEEKLKQGLQGVTYQK